MAMTDKRDTSSVVFGRRRVVGMLLLALTGCGLPLHEMNANRYFILTAGVFGPQDLPTPSPATVVAIAPVLLPPYLDHPNLVIRTASNEIKMASNHQWATALKENMSRVMVENLEQLLPGSEVFGLPVAWPRPYTYRLEVSFSRFEPTAEGRLMLTARWRIFQEHKHLRLNRLSEWTGQEVDVRRPAAMVEEMSHLLANLSQEMATAIAQLATTSNLSN